jgi:hypothetical protein
MTKIERSALQRQWVHSHEEDGEGETVFRPASYAFPPSRGRSGLDLHSDGSYGESAPGPTDRPEETGGGTWELDGDVLRLHTAAGGTQTLKVVSAEPDRLVVKR